jgi:AbiV family abortive infection protein
MTSKQTPTLTQDTLLEGAWYALEQCGLLLRNAATLYSVGARSSAVALAMFAREELGRHMILIKMWKDAATSGVPPTVEAVQQACDDHQAKQRLAQLSVTHVADRNSQLGQASQRQMQHLPQTPEYEKAEEVLEAFKERRSKVTPNERHQARQAALYVDIEDDGRGWNRPCEIDKEFAYRSVVDAIGDYHVRRDRLQPMLLKDDDPSLNAALQAWTDKPELVHLSHLPMGADDVYL